MSPDQAKPPDADARGVITADGDPAGGVGVDGNERYRVIVETCTDGIWTIDADNVTTFVNPALCQMLGYERHEMLGKSVLEFLDAAVIDEAKRSLGLRKEGVAERFERLFRAKDGHEVWTLLATSSFFDRDGEYTGALAMVTDTTAKRAAASENRRTHEMIRHQALHDGLTGLPNRALFLDRVAHALERNDRDRQAIAVFFIDLDQFKLVNDSLGHEAGDELLRLVAPRLAGAIRQGDTLARLGGDEFAVLCERLPSELAATLAANQLLAALEDPVVLCGDDHTVSASIGIAVSTGKTTPADLLRDADAAMYQAKAAGRGRAELFDGEMRARVLGRVRTEAALRVALADGDIYVHYQPLLSLRSGRIVGAEALARWRHADWGPVSPIEFIPVAEDSGLIHELGAQIMRIAAHDCAAWQGHPDFAGIAVNVSTRQLVVTDEVLELVRDVAAAEAVTPGFLTLEITESVLIEHLDMTRSALNALTSLGVRLSLDDFGTGYSSLSYLANLPFDSVKIDQSLIRDIVRVPRCAALAAAIIHMGHALELQVVAEGVETDEQVTRLRELDCDIAQGDYFGPPMAPEVLAGLLQQRSSSLTTSAAVPMTIARTMRRARERHQPA